MRCDTWQVDSSSTPLRLQVATAIFVHCVGKWYWMGSPWLVMRFVALDSREKCSPSLPSRGTHNFLFHFHFHFGLSPLLLRSLCSPSSFLPSTASFALCNNVFHSGLHDNDKVRLRPPTPLPQSPEERRKAERTNGSPGVPQPRWHFLTYLATN